VDAEVKKLLQLKADYKTATGQDWKPGAPANQTAGGVATPANQGTPGGAPSGGMADSAEALKGKIDAQGVKVRDLKAAKASKVCGSVWICMPV